MGKRKAKGLTGLSHFLSALQSDSTSKEQTVEVATEADNEPATKRTKIESITNVTETTRRRYNASGLVPYYETVDQVPEDLKKYFSQRLRLFSSYHTPPGCLLDHEGWYSVTPELIADQIANRCASDTILDAFCGVGGNAIAFAKTCERVIALDINPTRLKLARHNAQIYGVADRIEFIQADYLDFARSYLSLPSSKDKKKRKIDVVFLSPPWGGPSYLSNFDSNSSLPTSSSTDDPSQTNTEIEEEHPTYSLSSIQPINGKELFNLTRQITPNIAYFLPRNTSLFELSSLVPSDGVGEQERVEVEEEWMGTKLKALTCYFGGLVTGQEHLYDS